MTPKSMKDLLWASEIESHSGRTKAKLIGFPLLFWRFARQPLTWFPFYQTSSSDELRQLVRSALKDLETSIMLDDLARRPNGHFSRLLMKKEVSQVRRELNYAGNLLISLVTGHHTGKKGGVGIVSTPIGLKYNPKQTYAGHNSNRLLNIPSISDLRSSESISFSHFKRGELYQDHVIKGQTDPETVYELAFDPRNHIHIREQEIQLFYSTAKQMAEELLSKMKASEKLISVIAIDAMRYKDELDFFEHHVPGRSLGIHLLPSVLTQTNQRNPCLTATSWFSSELYDILGNVRVDILSSPELSAFHSLDKLCWEWIFDFVDKSETCVFSEQVQLLAELDNDHSLLRYYLDSGEDFNWIFDRLFWRSLDASSALPDEEKTIKWMWVKQGDINGLARAFDVLGNWIVAKPRLNLPWWSTEKMRVTIACKECPHQLNRVKKMLKQTDLIIERLNRESIDNLGRSGEFRSFWVLVPE